MQRMARLPAVLVASILAAALLGGCAVALPVPVSPTVAAATAAPSSTPAASPTFTPRPSRTPNPTHPPTATPRPTATPEPTIGFELVGQVGGEPLALTVQGTHAYVGVGLRLVIVDVSDPQQLHVLGKSEVLPAPVRVVAAAGDLAYVETVHGPDSCGPAVSQLLVLDVSDPTSPRVLGRGEPVPAWSWRLAVGEGYAYVGEAEPPCASNQGTGGVRVYDIADPAQPREAAYLPIAGGVYNLALDGGYLYTAGDALHVFAVQRPPNWREAASVPLAETAMELAVGDGRAFVGIESFDVRDPEHPAPGAPLPDDGLPMGVETLAMEGSRLYVVRSFCDVGECGSDLVVFDVAGFTAPRELASDQLPSLPAGLVVAEGRLYYLNSGWKVDAGSLHVYDTTELPLREAGTLALGGNAKGMVVNADGYAHVLMGGSLATVDLADPQAPQVVGEASYQELGITGFVYDLSVWNDLLYVRHEYGVAAVDLGQPHVPRFVGSYDEMLWSWETWFSVRLVATGGYLYVNGYECGLTVLDARDPAHIAPVQCLEVPPGDALAVAGGLLYTGGGGLTVLDISDAAAPQPMGSLSEDWPSADQITVGTQYAYLLGWNSDVRVIDITDKSAPREVGRLDPRWNVYGVALDRDLLYVATGSNGLGVLDVSDPRHPCVTGSYNVWGQANDVAVYDDLVLLTDNVAGLLVLRPVVP